MHILTLGKILLEEVLPLQWAVKGIRWDMECKTVVKSWRVAWSHPCSGWAAGMGFPRDAISTRAMLAWWGGILWSLPSLLTAEIDTNKANIFCKFWPTRLPDPSGRRVSASDIPTLSIPATSFIFPGALTTDLLWRKWWENVAASKFLVVVAVLEIFWLPDRSHLASVSFLIGKSACVP